MSTTDVVHLLRLNALLLLAVFAAGPAGAELGLVQDLSTQLPGELRAGPVVIPGRVIHRAVDGSWLRFKLRSDRGEFAYRVTADGENDGSLLAMRPTPAGAPEVRWEGQIVRVAEGGREFEGHFPVAGRMRVLRFVLGENVPRGADPAPTYRDVAYGPDERQRLDVYLAPGSSPRPVAIYIHGGGWTKGDKADLRGHHELIAAGISVVSINYRYCPPENPSAEVPAVSLPLHDAARAIQFVRSRAKAWHLDPARVGAWGASAGAFSALWTATHPDLADPQAADPVARESSRPGCVAGIFPQTSLDPVEMRAWVGPELTYGPHAFAISGGAGVARFDAFLAARERLKPWIAAYSPTALLSPDDGPVFLDYLDFTLTPSEPLDAYYTHSPKFGLGFRARAEVQGVVCHVRFAGQEDPQYAGWSAFLRAFLAP